MFRDGVWRTVYGWLDLERVSIHRDLKTRERLVANCHVPDTELFPIRYRSVGLRTVSFKAGLELTWFQLSMTGMALITRVANRLNLPNPDWTKLAAPLKRISEWKWVWALGSDCGGMRVDMDGVIKLPSEREPVPRRVTWQLYGGSGDGPQIPCTPAVVLIQKLIDQTITDAAAAELHRPILPPPSQPHLHTPNLSALIDSAAPSSTAGGGGGVCKRSPPLTAGAYPAVGLMTLTEFTRSLERYDIRWTADNN